VKIHRSRLDGFTRVPNETARDDRLSYHARGLLAEMLSRLDGWEESADAITARGRKARGDAAEGRRGTRAAMAELVAAGYVHRVRRRGPRGRWMTEVHVYDLPSTEVPDGGTSVRPGQIPVSAGGADVPPTGVPVSGTSNRRLTTEDSKKTKTGADEGEAGLQAEVECGPVRCDWCGFPVYPARAADARRRLGAVVCGQCETAAAERRPG
jgi:hypothetical protein